MGCKEEMDLDATEVLQAADRLYKEHGLSNTSELLGVAPEHLDSVLTKDWVVLIMNIMVLEFNQLLFKRRWPIQWGLKEAFTYLRTHTYHGPPYDEEYLFHDSFYLVTHIAFAISAYSAIKYDRKGNAQWAQFMQRLLKQVALHKLEVKVKYPKPRKSAASSSGPPPPGSGIMESACSSPRE